ncbi:MAG: YscO family type III secretion system apparatus protein [Candidatus Competibacteraceae bacterium]|nr:YscO family type III secretion system apparatus protein [Candidatus Competibacteraceae bacterium]
MKNDNWSALLRVREHRETQARAQLQEYRNQLAVCKRRLNQRQQAVARYQSWLSRREAELFAQLQTQPAKLRTVEDYQATLKGLRTEQEKLLVQLQQARDAANQGEGLVKQAEARVQKAAKAKEKLLEFTARQRQADQRQQEYAEEAELEEVAVSGLCCCAVLTAVGVRPRTHPYHRTPRAAGGIPKPAPNACW